jgi:hypothetical protein
MVFEESGINFDFQDKAIRGDGRHPNMPSVDFIISEPNKTYFLEVKSYPHEAFTGYESLAQWLARKFYASFAYEYAHENTEKPIHYCVLIEHPIMTTTDRKNLRNAIRGMIPSQIAFPRKFVHSVNLYSFSQWNTKFPQYSAVKTSS